MMSTAIGLVRLALESLTVNGGLHEGGEAVVWAYQKIQSEPITGLLIVVCSLLIKVT